jgi:enamine deaminase RidA (YjgF/YER057c/UK114 family)
VSLNRIWPAGVYQAGDPPVYAQVVEVVRSAPGRSIHLAGTYGCDATMTFPEGGLAEQMRVAFENIRRSLAAVGAKPSDVVRVKTYVADIAAFRQEGVAVFREFWGDEPPVSTTLQISAFGMPQALVEIEVYAELD